MEISFRQLLLAVEEVKKARCASGSVNGELKPYEALRTAIRSCAGVAEDSELVAKDLFTGKEHKVFLPDGDVERDNRLFKSAPLELIKRTKELCGIAALKGFLTHDQKLR